MHTYKLTVGLLLMGTSLAFSQGSLTPPGAPAPTMKTLDELDAAIGGVSNAVDAIQDEARTPISAPGYHINSSGSYYLTADLVTHGGISGILINADNVTLDLNGFSILGAGASAQGISMNDRDNVVVKNGTIRDSNYFGIAAFRTTRCRFKNLRVLGNGRAFSTYDGIHAGTNITITGCIVMGNGSGIEVDAESKIVGNQILDNANDGLKLNAGGSYVADNIVKGNGDNYDLARGNQLNILLCEIPETLNWPCSVKLAGTLICMNASAHGITVAADDVTIDMDGHTLIGPGASSGYGIYQSSPYRNLHIFNGKAVNWEGTYKAGIYAYGKSAILTDLQASTNYYGIRASSGSTLSGCTAYNNGDDGIYASDGSTLSDCTAYNNGKYGIFAYRGITLSGCTAQDNTGDGIYTSSGCTLSGCTAYKNGDDGIYTSSGCTVSGCMVQENIGDGIQVSSNCKVTGNTCSDNGKGGGDGAGIHVISSDNRIDGNNVTDNDRGIVVDTYGNFIVRNSASGNATNYDIAAGNDTGTIQTTPVGAGAWDNFSF